MKDKIKSLFQSRKFRYGSTATILTISVLAAIIFVNIGLSMIAEQHPMSIDTTANKFYAMSQQTVDYLNSLNKNVEITVLNDKDAFKEGSNITDSQYYSQASNIIDQYAQHSDKVSISYVNMVNNPAISTQYSKDNLETNNIIVKSDDQYKILRAKDLFDQQLSYQTYSYVITASRAEQAITSAILNVTSDEKVKLQFIKGYEEDDESSLQSLLEDNNYDVSEISILTNDISPDVKIAVIFAPKRDYDLESIDKLNSFMENGKSEGKTVVYIANPEQGEVPNLNSFLNNWGITVDNGTVFETSADKLFSMNSLFYAITDYVDSFYTENISRSVPVAMPLSKPINIDEESSVDVKTLLQFSKTSGIYPIDADESWTISDDKISGPIAAVTVSTKNNEGDIPSNVAVIGSSVAFDTSLLSKSALNNSIYFINMFNKLCEVENTIVIEPKSVDNHELGLTASQSNTLGLLFVVVLPLTLLITGIFIWLRRRNR